MEDYDETYRSFDWSEVYGNADWDAPDEINVAHETCDRHAEGGDNDAMVARR
jgi:acetyl-CoA synthetase